VKRLLAGVAWLVSVGIAAALGSSPAGPAADERHRRDTRKHGLRTLAQHFALLLAALAVGGFLVAASGIIPIKASSGHWAVTRWFLDFGQRRSFATHSLGVRVPPLDSLDRAALVLKGAGHYETGCAPCHGSPAMPRPRVTLGMTPAPPYLPRTLADWEPQELFTVIKHGIKFAGMPAWATQERDDEVWAMVAFLRAYPGMDARSYRRLVYPGSGPGRARGDEGDAAPIHDLLGPAEVPEAVVESCARCHGDSGLGRGEGAFPRLAGQRPAYLYASLRAFADGERHSGIMEPVAAGLSDAELRALARYYARLPATSGEPVATRPDAAAVARGETIARRGVPLGGIPACAACHGPTNHPRNPHYPDLAGQYADYLVLQLRLFNGEHRGGSPYARLMQRTAHQLDPEQMRDVARYYASLGSVPRP
jgi:cytochrome c553